MLEIFKSEFQMIEQVIARRSSSDYPSLFDRIPLEVFGAFQIDRPPGFPIINRLLPVMPSEEVQNNWTGSSGHRLLQQSVAFIRTVLTHYHIRCRVPLADATVLDYGCGWGRLIRLLYKYVPYGRIWGLDPWDTSITICRESNILANLRQSDYLPKSLPVEGQYFDLIISFSVFSHLSQRATQMAATVLSNHLKVGGLLAITIRPQEYWAFHSRPEKLADNEVSRLQAVHQHEGFAFIPHNRAPVEGDITYGDTSMSIEHVQEVFPALRVVGIDWNETDPLQIVVFLTKPGIA